VPESKFLLISSSLGTSSQGVKQRILREQSGSAALCQATLQVHQLPWRMQYNPLTHRRMSSKSHESMKFAIKDWGWFLMLGRISTLLDTGIH